MYKPDEDSTESGIPHTYSPGVITSSTDLEDFIIDEDISLPYQNVNNVILVNSWPV